MRKLMLVCLLVIGLGQGGCAFLGGAAVGAGATGAGYEYQAYNQMNKLEDEEAGDLSDLGNTRSTLNAGDNLAWPHRRDKSLDQI
jgi:hypothetical protein